MTSIKKQALKDANELFETHRQYDEISLRYWDLINAFTAKGREDKAYATVFDQTFKKLGDSYAKKYSLGEPLAQAVVEPVKRRGLRINKTFVVGVLIGVAVHELELDKFAVAKAKQAYKRFAR